MDNYEEIMMPKYICSERHDILYLDSLFEQIEKNGEEKKYVFNYRKTKFFASELYGYYHYKVRHLKEKNIEIVGINASEDVDVAMHLTAKHSDDISPHYSSAISSKDFSDDLLNGDFDCFDIYMKREFLPKCVKNAYVVDFISQYLSELFVNARTHGQTTNIVCGGQIYYSKGTIRFVIVDFGVTIPYNVANHQIKDKLNYFNDNDSAAIKWATMPGNSTKDKLGGLGLTDITAFLDKYNGRIQIISRNGFYEYMCGRSKQVNFSNAFNGTFIVIELDVTNLKQIKKPLSGSGSFNI